MTHVGVTLITACETRQGQTVLYGASGMDAYLQHRLAFGAEKTSASSGSEHVVKR
jgi:hypothetical protein